MTPARFQTIEQIYREALTQQPDQISGFLNNACKGDAALRHKVEELLSSRQQADGFIETSAVSLAARIIQNGEAESLVGQTIGHYKICESIGAGGMGEVYLATDIVAGRKAALKLLPFRFTGNAERRERFQREARAVVGLNHPNILTVYEIGEDRSTHYIASELIEGDTLRERLTRGPMPLNEAVEIAIQVAGALVAAQETGVVHRDIKPENIMLRPDGYVKVLDFGIAKLAEREVPVTMPRNEALLLVETNLGSILGTVRYMSPEQACGAPVDKRTDIWSLGVVLYEMLTGHAPFTGDTPRETMSAILRTEPRPVSTYLPRIPIELQQILSKTLRKNPEERYQSARELLQAIKGLRHKLEVEAELDRSTAVPLWARWTRSPATLVLILLVAALAAVAATLFLLGVNRQKITSAAAGDIAPSAAEVTQLPEKSIAVLPFESLSKDEESAFFAGGVQDEILTDLAKVADLKVISRTSVMKYKSGLERNLREIARALGVSHVVEGTVQRAAGRVRVNVQLIDARIDAHVWAEHYDREVSDIFAIQSDIAERIADQLRAKLSGAEKAAIAERPTADLIAYTYYAKAKGMNIYEDWEGGEKPGVQKVELLEKATQRDPNFALAYCELTEAHIKLIQFTSEAEESKHLEFAKKAAETALRLRPDLGEPHLALALYYWFAGGFVPPSEAVSYYGRARDELTIVQQKLPNNAEALMIGAMIGRHQNRWDASLADLKKANEVDPGNTDIALSLWQVNFEMRRYSDAEKLTQKKAASSKGENPGIKRQLAEIKLAQGDPVAAQALLDQIPLDFNPAPYIWGTRLKAALYLRDNDAANHVVAMAPQKWASQFEAFDGPPEWANGQIARARGDSKGALAAFAASRKMEEARNRSKPEDISYRALARYDAGLGRKDEAIREARRVVEIMPIAADSLNGPYNVANLALVLAWTGEREAALEQLEKVATLPGFGPTAGLGATYGDLRFNPCWDNLRGDPRFDKIVAATKAASR